MQLRVMLLATAAAVGLFTAPHTALAQKKGGAFVADNVLWLPEVFAELTASNKQAVQGERLAEDAIFKKIERALARDQMGTITRSDVNRILSTSNLNRNARDLTASSSTDLAYAGLDRMVGIGVGPGATSFRLDLSANLLPTLLVPTVSGGEITGYANLDTVYDIGRVLRGKGGAKIAKNGINYNPSTGELQVNLRKPFADKQFVKLVLELDDGSAAAKGKRRGKAGAAPSFQITVVNTTLPIGPNTLTVPGTSSGGTVTSFAQDIEDLVTADRPGMPSLVAAVQNASSYNPATGQITDSNTNYVAAVSNGVLFKKFNVNVTPASPS
ncbi:MAG: hypothetical protein RMK81_16565 [Geminicoccaceae bacterium]|nr:hypothetical protein [Geminicoccaceae bacterium]